MKVLGLIPARGGSKGVPEKNLTPLAGKSLVERTFDCAVAAGVLDRIIISTDDNRIAKIASRIGLEVPFIRPARLATDQSPMIDVVLHAERTLRDDGYRCDAVMLLQPTSPLRRPEHLLRALQYLENGDSVCSVIAIPKELCPHFVMKTTPDGYLDYFLEEGKKFIRRQDVPQAYVRDGTVYLVRTNILREMRTLYGRKCVPMFMDPKFSLSIDSLNDWEEAERRLVYVDHSAA